MNITERAKQAAEREYWALEHGSGVGSAVQLAIDEAVAEKDKEIERLKADARMGVWQQTCIHHTDAERIRCQGCPVCLTAEVVEKQTEIERLKLDYETAHNEFHKVNDEMLELQVKNSAMAKLLDSVPHDKEIMEYGFVIPCSSLCPRCQWDKMKGDQK